MNNDSYKNDTDRIQRLIGTIRGDIQKREQKKNLGQATSMIDGEIRGGLTNLERELDLLKALIDRQQNNKEIMIKEGEARKNKYLEFVNAKQEIKQQFDNVLQTNNNGLFNERNQNNNYKNTDAIRGMDQKQLHENQKQLEKEQDKKLDDVLDNLGNLNKAGKQINTTVKDQNNLLEKVNRDVDKTNQDLIKTNSKLKKFIAHSSNCCLGVIIFLELASLVCLIIFL